jgi:hypothetical protein
MPVRPAPYLRQGLLSNATTNFGLALFMLVAASLLAAKLGIPPAVLVVAAVALVASSVWLARLSLQDTASRRVLQAVILVNLLWAVDSIALVAFGIIEPSRAGIALVVAQAATAAMYAGLQQLGIRRSLAA